jgi:hypothetical protein
MRLSRVRHVARCPVAWRINLNPDHKAVVRKWLAMGNAAKRFETSTDRSDRKLLIGLPNPPGHNSSAVTADVDGSRGRSDCRLEQLHFAAGRDGRVIPERTRLDAHAAETDRAC